MMHQSSSGFGSSASSLARQLSSSIEDKPYEPEPVKPISYKPKKSLATPVQSRATADLIAKAIVHQQQKAAGIEPEEEEAQSNSFSHPFSSGLSNAVHDASESVSVTQQAAPVMSLSSQTHEKPIVTKDELMEGNQMNLSAQDSVAKDNAVIATL